MFPLWNLILHSEHALGNLLSFLLEFLSPYGPEPLPYKHIHLLAASAVFNGLLGSTDLCIYDENGKAHWQGD
jgi:hypothetical protein